MSKKNRQKREEMFVKIDKNMRLVCHTFSKWRCNGVYPGDFHSIKGLMRITGRGFFHYQDNYY